MATLRITGGQITLPSNSVTNEQIDSDTDIDADKLEHLYKPGTNFDLAIGGTPVAREEIVFVASTAGVIRGFHAMLNDTGTSTDVTFDLKINGTTALSATINLTHADADRAVKDGTLSTTTVAVDDVISISMAVTASTGAQGPWAWCEIQEVAA